MNPKTKKEAGKIVQSLLIEIKNLDLGGKKIIICPPFLYLDLFQKSDKIKQGAQNLFFEQEGSFTGEISAPQLKDFGVEYVIIGHGERRIYFNETDEIINKKIKIALENSLIPIFCIGENLDQFERGETIKVLEKQITQGLKDISSENKIIIAYEPIWAIGTGKIPTYSQVLKIKNKIIKILGKLQRAQWGLSATPPEPQAGLVGTAVLPEPKIIYGGSINIDNAKGFIEGSKMDGLLIGKISLDTNSFIKIIKSI